MAVLNKIGYGEILFASNPLPEIQDITEHFLAEHRKNVTDNPRFLEKLKELIQSTKTKIDELRKQKIAQDERDDYKNPDGSPMQENDYKKYRFGGNKLGFGLLTFPGGDRMSMNKINDIEKAFEQFMKKVKKVDLQEPDILQKQDGNFKGKKLVWKGTPAQFGFIIIELIGKGYLERPTGSFSRDAEFFLSLFDIRVKGNPTTTGTIAKELNDKENSLSPKNASLLKLPDIKKLT